jgi:hypothetical protein
VARACGHRDEGPLLHRHPLHNLPRFALRCAACLNEGTYPRRTKSQGQNRPGSTTRHRAFMGHSGSTTAPVGEDLERM